MREDHLDTRGDGFHHEHYFIVILLVAIKISYLQWWFLGSFAEFLGLKNENFSSNRITLLRGYFTAYVACDWHDI